ncbi:MAG: TetR/AcrR family transcriptional regulator [Deltaproteobacteria bacterium]|nr:TetR/AcrR family transcriptional regulator [Deltaproteobacteria bacterium]
METERKRPKGKRTQIITASVQVFAQKGFSSATMKEIAVQAGIGKGTIYEYFPSKEELFFAVFEWYVGEFGSKTIANIAALGGSARERLQAMNEALMKSWGELKDVYTLSMEFWSASASSQMRERFKEAFRQSYRDFRRIVASLIREGVARGEFRSDVDPESVSAALVGTWDALLLQAWFEDDFDPLKTATKYMAIFVRGLAAQPLT